MAYRSLTNFAEILHQHHIIRKGKMMSRDQNCKKRYQNTFPYSIINLFQGEVWLRNFFEFLLDELIEDAEKGRSSISYMPPAVYSQPSKTINFHYNYLVKMISKWSKNDEIFDDFYIMESDNEDKNKYGRFLINVLFDSIFNITKVNINVIDLTKYRNAKKLTISSKYYHNIIYQRGGNYTKFAAIPISAKRLKELLGDEYIEQIIGLLEEQNIEQVAFRDTACNALEESLGMGKIAYYEV